MVLYRAGLEDVSKVWSIALENREANKSVPCLRGCLHDSWLIHSPLFLEFRGQCVPHVRTSLQGNRNLERYNLARTPTPIRFSMSHGVLQTSQARRQIMKARGSRVKESQ
jgi:hypothetical protein